jgi:hypothetical protein
LKYKYRDLFPNKPVILYEDSKLGVASTDFSFIQNTQLIEVKTISCEANSVVSKNHHSYSKDQLKEVQFGENLTKDQKSRLKTLIEPKSEAF